MVAHAASPAGRDVAVAADAQPLQPQQPQPKAVGSSNRRSVLGSGAALAAAAAACELVELAGPSPAVADQVISSDWEVVELPVDKGVVLLDIGFTGSDPNHGFLIGTRQTLLETVDGGKTWNPRDVAAAQDEGFNYRFNSISFSGDEGWIVGKPAILLHTTDGGKSWERVPLSAKLPGTPILITAGKNSGEAEMTTDQGAIYVTDNGAYTWSAAVQETVDATLNRTVSSGINGASYYEGYFSNVRRNDAGDYVAVSSRGNFFMSWEGGQTYWQPHNRPAARRIQNMGWTPDNRLWLTTRGGDLLFASENGITETFDSGRLNSRGFGILDVGFKDNNTVYACGGSGSLFKSADGGSTWRRDKGGDGVPANLYEIKFFGDRSGFVLGNDSVLLRYIGA
uniref:Photosystem II stability/assembly factor n=1 Tax=Chlamydomonas euryale TaxID=1486919 RepID=A0A7R9V5I5_9CHLO